MFILEIIFQQITNNIEILKQGVILKTKSESVYRKGCKK